MTTATKTKTTKKEAANKLSAEERKRFKQLEGVIERGLAKRFEIGHALREIREGRLYKETHNTFDRYVRERWSMTRHTAFGYIELVEVSKNVGTPLPSVAHAHTLASLKPAEQKKVASKVIPLAVRETRRVVREIRGGASLTDALNGQVQLAVDGATGGGSNKIVRALKLVEDARETLTRGLDTWVDATADGEAASPEQRNRLKAVLDDLRKTVERGAEYVEKKHD